MEMKRKVSPSKGGCWYCFIQDDKLLFDTEFDTFVHLSCVEKAVRNEPEDPEARIIYDSIK